MANAPTYIKNVSFNINASVRTFKVEHMNKVSVRINTRCTVEAIPKQVDLKADAKKWKKDAKKARCQVKISSGADVRVPNLGVDTEVLVMNDSLSVLSLGRLCREKGYSFRWGQGQATGLVLPNGKTRVLEVDSLPRC